MRSAIMLTVVYADCSVFIVMLSVFMLNAITPIVMAPKVTLSGLTFCAS
jgi:hypothetical protein